MATPPVNAGADGPGLADGLTMGGDHPPLVVVRSTTAAVTAWRADRVAG